MNLDQLSRPMTRAEALASGALVDTTAAASWMGFRIPAAVTAAVWAECVGDPGAHATGAERLAAAHQLRALWQDVQRVVLVYRKQGRVMGAFRLGFIGARGRRVDLRVVAGVDEHGASVLTVFLQGEC